MQSNKNTFIYIILLCFIINIYCDGCRPGEHYFLKKCFPCLSGTYSPSGNGCIMCDPGTYSYEGSQWFYPCRPGTYANNHGTSRCFKCEPGSYAPDYGMTGCYSCPSGYTSDGGATECYKKKEDKKEYNFGNDYYYNYKYF